MSPQEIHDLGLKEVSRIRSEMTQIVRKDLGRESADLKSFIEELRKDRSFYFDAPEELMARFKHLIEQEINPKLASLFWKPPTLPLEYV